MQFHFIKFPRHPEFRSENSFSEFESQIEPGTDVLFRTHKATAFVDLVLQGTRGIRRVLTQWQSKFTDKLTWLSYEMDDECIICEQKYKAMTF